MRISQGPVSGRTPNGATARALPALGRAAGFDARLHAFTRHFAAIIAFRERISGRFLLTSETQ
jgi:hypothetical protein